MHAHALHSKSLLDTSPFIKFLQQHRAKFCCQCCHCRFELKGGGAEMGRSPPRGGVDAGAANQQFVIAEVDSEEGGGRMLVGGRIGQELGVRCRGTAEILTLECTLHPYPLPRRSV